MSDTVAKFFPTQPQFRNGKIYVPSQRFRGGKTTTEWHVLDSETGRPLHHGIFSSFSDAVLHIENELV